jgi:thiosulfate dehydrogenase
MKTRKKFLICLIVMSLFTNPNGKLNGQRIGLLILVIIAIALVLIRANHLRPVEQKPMVWRAPDTTSLAHNAEGDLIRYGRKLISNTSHFLGPRGIIAKRANGMNCQNCHLDAGTRPFANCFAAVSSSYPLFRARSGILESVEFRVNDCMKRSMNGIPIDSVGMEMHAMVAYIKWVGKNVNRENRPTGIGVTELPFLQRAADTLQGKVLYASKCQVCHGAKGEGIANNDGGYLYPPLWGNASYNTGAGLLRLSRFAGYIKYSMPLGASFEAPLLSNEEAWDIAAFVDSRPRPTKVFTEDWPDLSKKAIDYPFGPYVDNFPESQHRFGPFQPIKDYYSARK